MPNCGFPQDSDEMLALNEALGRLEEKDARG